MSIYTRTPEAAVEAIKTTEGSLELRIPNNVNPVAFKARIRYILRKQKTYVRLLNAKRNNWKGILVMK
jgi:hypothetical protein